MCSQLKRFVIPRIFNAGLTACAVAVARQVRTAVVSAADQLHLPAIEMLLEYAATRADAQACLKPMLADALISACKEGSLEIVSALCSRGDLDVNFITAVRADSDLPQTCVETALVAVVVLLHSYSALRFSGR